MNILITGSKGQLGTELRQLSSGYSHHRFLFTDTEDLDITRAEKVEAFFKIHPIDVCINCAAYTAVDKAESEKETAMAVNATAVGHIAKVCAEHRAKLIHISTDFVFDGSLARPLTEKDPTHPLNVYGNTKLQGETLAMQYLSETIIIRTAWVYSAFGNNFVKTILRLCREKPQVNVIYDQIGTPTHAGDLAAAILHIINNGQYATQKGIFHFTNEGVCSWYDFAIAVRDFAGLNTPIYPIETHEYPTPAVRPKFSVLNKNLFKKTFHYEIPYWRSSLEKCVKTLVK